MKSTEKRRTKRVFGSICDPLKEEEVVKGLQQIGEGSFNVTVPRLVEHLIGLTEGFRDNL